MAQVLKEDIRNKMLSSALNCFKENGYNKTTMREIAGNAGVSVGNLYRYFPDKRAMYDEIIAPFYEGMIELSSNARHRNKSMPPSFQGNREFIELYKNNRDIVTAVFKDTDGIEFHETIEIFSEMLKDNFVLALKTQGIQNQRTEILAKSISNSLIYGFITIVTKSDSLDPVPLIEKYLSFTFGNMQERIQKLKVDNE